MPDQQQQTTDTQQTGPTPEQFAAMKSELDGLKASQSSQAQKDAEKDAAIKYWFEKASTSAKTEPNKEADPEPEEDVLALLTEKGAKGLDQLLSKRGYVRGEDVEKRVNAKAEQLTREARLSQQYDDLKNPDSEFFKATALEYGELVKQGVSQSLAMEMAAERTELKFMREGKIETPAAKKARVTEERKTRAKAQAGDVDRRPAVDSEEDDELSAEQLEMCAAMGVDPEKYKARAKAGVNMAAGKAR